MIPVAVKIGGLGVALYLLLKKGGRDSAYPSTPLPPGAPAGDPLADWEREEDEESGPQIGDFWVWPSSPLPLIKRDGRHWGVYSPRGRFPLLAVLDNGVSEDGRYLVVGTGGTSVFPPFFPTANVAK